MFLFQRFKHKGHERRKVFFASLVSFVFVLSACTQTANCSSEKVFCAALVTNTQGIQDHGINQDTWAGMEEARANGLADRIEYIESVDTRDYAKNMAYFADKGFDVIVTSGPGMDDETLLSADRYPDSVFIGMNQPQAEIRPNLLSITFPEDQMGFLSGVLAARITKTQIVGAVCETSDIDSTWRFCEGFRAGVKFAAPDVKAQVVYNEQVSSEKLFIDDTWGYETGQTLIQRGADVIFAAGGATGQGALRAAAEAQVHAIGVERDQAAALAGSGSSVVTSFWGEAGFEVQNAIRQIREGNPPKAGTGRIKFLPLNQNFPEALGVELNDLLLQFLNGEIKTGVAPEKP